jgi:hypothetical protein
MAAEPLRPPDIRVLLPALLRLGQVLLSAACLLALLSGARHMLRADSVPHFDLPASPEPTSRELPFARYELIVERELFGSEDEPVPAEEPVPEVLPESPLAWELVGTISMNDLSIAALKSTSPGGGSLALRVGEELEPGIVVMGIERQRVRINNAGVPQQISMEEQPDAKGRPLAHAALQRGSAPRSGPPTSARSVPVRAPLRPVSSAPPPSSSSPPERPAPAPAGPASQDPIQRFMEGAQMTPVHDDGGSIVGLRLSQVRPDGPFAALPAGTICHDVNGVSLGQMHLALQRLSDDPSACVHCTVPDGGSKSACL